MNERHPWAMKWFITFYNPCLDIFAKFCNTTTTLVLFEFLLRKLMVHTTYSRNIMGQKCEVNCGLWVLNEIIKKTYPENLKKIVGAVGLDWLCYLAGNSQMAPMIFFKFSGYIFFIISLRIHKPQLPSHF